MFMPNFEVKKQKVCADLPYFSVLAMQLVVSPSEWGAPEVEIG